MIDVLKVKEAIKRGEISAYIMGDGIYLRDTGTGEVVKIGDTERRTDA